MRHLLLAATACGLLVSAAASAQTFSFATLDNPGDPTFNQLLGINDHGVIVGYFGAGTAGHPNIGYQISPPYTAFTSNNQPGSVQTQAIGINNAGLTTGFWSDTNVGNNMDANFAFIRMPTGKNFTYVSATNPLTAGTPRISQVTGINNSNVAAGFYLDAANTAHGYTYSLSTAAYAPVNISGTTGVSATGINDNGQVSGFFGTKSGKTFGFVKNANGGVVTHFSVPGSKTTQLFGINNSGVAVGSYTDAQNVTHGLYYTPGTGVWIPINDPDGSLGTVVNGINNMNQLVGFYIDAAGNFHGMLVTVTK